MMGRGVMAKLWMAKSFMNRSYHLLSVGLLLPLCLWSCSPGEFTDGGRTGAKTEVGTVLPGSPILKLINGGEIDQAAFRGKPVCDLNRKLAFAHYTAWHDPHYATHDASGYYNYPLFAAAESPPESYRREVQLALAAGLDGFFVDLVGHAKKKTSFVSQTEALLKAAQGTPFMVTGCLDRSHPDLEWAVSELKRIIPRFAAYENFPRVDGRPLIVSYSSGGRKPEQWAKIKEDLKAAGMEIFLVLDMQHGFKELKQERTAAYAEVADMLYSFSEIGISGQPPRECFDLIANGAAQHGKTWMATLYPGYAGGWYRGRNDHYQPHRGFDCLWDSFQSFDPDSPTWLHLTTWNDHDETPFMPMAFEFGANSEVSQAVIEQYFRKQPAPAGPPRVFFAYHREEIPGTVLRLEALSLPRRSGGTVTVRGALANPLGRKVYELKPQRLDLADFDRCEWHVPTAELAGDFALVPEIALSWEDGRTTPRQLPAVLLKQGWIQNQVTVKVPFHAMSVDEPALSVDWQRNVLQARVQIPEGLSVARATLWRNDRPIARLLPTADAEVGLSLNWSPARNHHLKIALKKGRFIHVKRNLIQKDYRWDAGSFAGKSNLDWAWYTARLACDPDVELEVTVNKEAPVTVTPAEILRYGELRLGKDRSCILQLSEVDGALREAEPLFQTGGALQARVFSRAVRDNDIFYARIETTDGKVCFSRLQAPGADGMAPLSAKLVQTMVNLETSSGATGMPGQTGYLGTPPYMTPELGVFKVHPATIRRGFWDFEEGGSDSLGNMSFRTPKKAAWLGGEKLIKPAGPRGSSCLVLGNDQQVAMRRRSYPLGGCTIACKLYLEQSPTGEARLIGRSGWTSALNLFLTPGRQLKLVRDGGDKTPKESVLVPGALPLETWVALRVTFDEEVVKAYVDGRLVGEGRFTPNREYGNCTAIIGDKENGLACRVDDLLILSYPAEPEERQCSQ